MCSNERRRIAGADDLCISLSFTAILEKSRTVVRRTPAPPDTAFRQTFTNRDERRERQEIRAFLRFLRALKSAEIRVKPLHKLWLKL